MNKTIQIALIAMCCAEVFIGTNAWWFSGRKLDCRVSTWSAWSTPYGFGQISRERTILLHPTNGGSACPSNLIENRYTTPMTINQTARAMAENFLFSKIVIGGRTRRTIGGGQQIEKLRDLLVILDSSGSIGSTGFTTATSALAKLLGLMCPENDPFRNSRPHHQQSALLRYSTNVDEIFDFNDNSNTQLLKNAITGTNFTGGSTCTAKALNYATDNMFQTAKGMRTGDVVQEVLILTDGQSNCGGDVFSAAHRLQGKADVFALVIGTQSSAAMDEMTRYVSPPASSHLFAVPGKSELKQLVDAIESFNFPCVPFTV